MKSKTKPKPDTGALQPVHSWKFEAIGTTWWVGIYEPVAPVELRSLESAIAAIIHDFDARFSRFRPDSLVSGWSQSAGEFEMPADLKDLLDLYNALYTTTDGSVTPLIGQVLADAGYDAEYSLRPSPTRRPPQLSEVLRYDASTITILQPALLDFGAAGKGYLVDLVCKVLTGRGISHFCVDAGGDMRYSPAPDAEPLSIGLEHPDDPALAIGVARLAGGALCGSAGNRRAWGEYTHIIDPATQKSPRHLSAVWVTAASAAAADGLATALYFACPERLARDFTFEYAVLDDKLRLNASPGFPAEFYLKS